MSDETRRRLPPVSGNDMNGLGETSFRRPRIVFWPNDSRRAADGGSERTSTHPFGPLIDYFRRLSHAKTPKLSAVYTDTKNRAPGTLDPIADRRNEDTPENWAAKVKAFVLAHDGDYVGVTRLNPAWFFDEFEAPDLPWVVMIGGRMDYEAMRHMPPTADDPRSAIEVGEVYNQVDRAAGALANWIRAQGWYAENQGGPASGQMTLIPAALQCGFGELGKHGSIIHREFGSLLRLSAVRTDLPLVPDAADQFGADDFCLNCRVCTDACPPDAIFDDKQMVRGERKWYVDFDKCLPYFVENMACGICIAVCPWSRPGVAPTLAQKMLRRRERAGPLKRRSSGQSCAEGNRND